jgi:hypothetical protein
MVSRGGGGGGGGGEEIALAQRDLEAPLVS